jgi:hypothetical protein
LVIPISVIIAGISRVEGSCTKDRPSSPLVQRITAISIYNNIDTGKKYLSLVLSILNITSP